MSSAVRAGTWRHVAPISKVEADRLIASRADLVQFLSDRFRHAFGVSVEDSSVGTFPDGLSVTLVANVTPHPKYNVWALTISRAFADAGAACVARRASDNQTAATT